MAAASSSTSSSDSKSPKAKKKAVIGITGKSEFHEIEKQNIVATIGQASDGKSVMIICACKIPINEHFDFNLLQQYVSSILDANLTKEYYLVYFHCNSLNEMTKSKQWLRDLFNMVYKKENQTNIKKFFIVHPSQFIRTLWYLAAPLLMLKFKHKIRYVNTLKELKSELPYNELIFHLPIHVLEQDKLITENCKSNLQDEEKSKSKVAPLLNAVIQKKKSNRAIQILDILLSSKYGDSVPPAIKQCIDYLSSSKILSTKDLFQSTSYNINTSHQVMDALKKDITVDLEDYKDPFMVAAILKQLFREMPEPLLTYDLYDEIMAFNNLRHKLAAAKVIILYRLPKNNFKLLEFLLAFLLRILEYNDKNKMSARKVSAIFAPLIMRQKKNHNNMTESVLETYDATEFLKFLLEQFLDVFTF